MLSRAFTLARHTNATYLAYRFQIISRSMASIVQNGDHKIQVKKIAGSLGAEIHNVDLRNLDNQTTKDVRQALLDHKVIFFRNQELAPKDFLTFASRFGQPIEYPFVKGIDGYPEIIQVLKRENEKINFGGVWHCDTLYLDEPPMGKS